jgi:hypothetical protein
MDFPNKSTIGGMTAYHEGNLTVDKSSLLTAGTNVTINTAKVLYVGGVLIFNVNITLATTVSQWSVLLTINNGYYCNTHTIDNSNGIQISQNEAGALFFKAINATGLAAGTYDIVCSIILN